MMRELNPSLPVFHTLPTRRERKRFKEKDPDNELYG